MQALTDIRKVIQDFVVDATGLAGSKVIWANQGPARPAKPYGLLNIISGIDDAAPRPSIVMADNASPSEQRELLLHGDLTLSINMYALQYPEAFDLMHSVKAALANDISREALKRKQLTIVEVTTVINDKDYTVTIDDVPITITSDSSTTDKEIRDALVAAINASVFINTQAFDVDDAGDPLPDNILWVKNFPGVEFNISVSTELTITSQTNAVSLSYIRNNGVTDLTQLLETDFEGRAQMDIIFATPLRITDKPSIIEEVEITNLLDGETIVIGA